MAGDDRRVGRGRLSSIDLLPEEAEPDVVWVSEELRAGKRLQIDILQEFNSRLADRGIGPVSSSAFNRYSVRKAMQFRQLDEVRRISSELASSLGTDGTDKLTIAVSEMVKMAAFKILEGGVMDPKGVMELARASQAAASAQKISADHRRAIERDERDRAVKAVEKVATARGMTRDTVEAIKREILGIAS
jgi:hypothetical protein